MDGRQLCELLRQFTDKAFLLVDLEDTKRIARRSIQWAPKLWPHEWYSLKGRQNKSSTVCSLHVQPRNTRNRYRFDVPWRNVLLGAGERSQAALGAALAAGTNRSLTLDFLSNYQAGERCQSHNSEQGF